MASDTAQTQNGISNGENESTPPFGEERRSTRPNNPDLEDKNTRNPEQGTKEQQEDLPTLGEETRSPEEEDPLPDYEYYESLEGPLEHGADSSPTEAQGGSVKGTREEEQDPPSLEDEKTTAEDEDSLPDYEYYETLEALLENCVDSPATEAQGGSAKGTPHDSNDDTTNIAAEKKDTQDSLKLDKSTDETDSNQTFQGTESTGRGSASNRDVDEASEGTETTTPPKTEETNGEVSNNKKDGNGERPVRQQLKKTSIAEAGRTEPVSTESNPVADDHSMASSQDSQSGKAGQASESSSTEGRGRVRKRSFDDLDEDSGAGTAELKDNDDNGHQRKRSRDSKEQSEDSKSGSGDKGASPEEDIAKDTAAETPHEETVEGTPPKEQQTEEHAERIRSPKKKRSRDQFDADHLKAIDNSVTAKATVSGTAEGEPEKKRHRDNSQEKNTESKPDVAANETSLPKAFANAAAASPFSSLPASKPDAASSKSAPPKGQSLTSSSAFSSSTLSAFAGSEKSPFGAIGGSESVFKSSPAPTTDAKEGGPSSDAFSKSAFGAVAESTSAFGSISGGGFADSAAGSGFGLAALKPSRGLTSFAAPGGSAILGSTSKPKVLGADSDDEDDENEDHESQGFEGLEKEKEKEDGRFYKQATETGEEGEETYFACRSKLFHFDGKDWRERGVGTFKVNVKEDGAEDDQPGDDVEAGTATKKSARMIMRAEGVLRVVLNAPLFKEMKVGSPTGEEPTGKQVALASVENGKTVPLLLRTGSAELAKDLYHTIQELLPQL